MSVTRARFREQPVPPSVGSPAAAWHALDVSRVLILQDSGTEGLNAADAAARLACHGSNRLPRAQPRSAWWRLFQQFHNLLIYVLLGAAVLSLLTGHPVDAGVIIAVVLVNTLVGFVQEGRAERALEAIRSMIDPKAVALRDGCRVTVPADGIAPGDVVLLEAGDRVPADLRLIRTRNLKIEEAVLTGESVAVDKDIAPVSPGAALGDRTSMAYSGTFVAAGQGAGVAVATGAGTELGRISCMLGGIEPLRTPLLRQMEALARQLTGIILVVAGGAFLFAVLVRGYSAADALMIVVGLAVAAIPEGLPAVMTIALAVGVQRMARRHAIIRRLPAVETLGSVSVICTDKTGTLTRNEMTAWTLFMADGEYQVTGTGYAPVGEIRGGPADPNLLRAAMLCNDAELRESAVGWVVDGDPMEGALLALAMKAGADPAAELARRPRLDLIPFDAQHRFMATLHAGEAPIVYIKGAPERVIEMCVSEYAAGAVRPVDAQRWLAEADRLAAQGQRLLAFAMKPLPPATTRLDVTDVERDAVLLGLIGFIDLPRDEAVTAVKACRDAGIRVVMITGDHAATAREVARQLGLSQSPRVVTGRELEALDREGFAAAAREADVFARTTPEHKLRLVMALQADGCVVAMTGDGVNDAPALKRADVGVAMGQKGTEASKQAAEMVLADDNFASIAAAVREGRTVYDNLRKVIAWTLPTNGGEALTILLAIVLGLALPVTPIQILWINMVTAVALGLTLAFEPAEPGVMRRPPRAARAGLLTGVLLWRIGFVSALMSAGAFGTYLWASAQGHPEALARTLVVNALVVMEIFYLFSVRYVHGTSLTLHGVVGTPAVLAGLGAVVVAQLLFTYWPPLQTIFGTRPIDLGDGAVVVLVGVVLLLIAEAEKLLVAQLRRPKGGTAGGKEASLEHGHDKHRVPPIPASGNVRDPVCGPTVDPANTARHAEDGGTVHHFCCEACRTKFLAHRSSM